MDALSNSDLCRLAAKHRVDILGMTEKHELVNALQDAAPEALLLQEAAPSRPLAAPSRALAAPMGGGAGMPANMSLVPVQASQRVSDMDMQLLPRHDLLDATGSDTCGNPEEAVSITRDIQQRAQQARGPQRQAVLNQWHPINDLAAGLGRWCCVEPGSDGPAIFYPGMRQNRLALAFQNQRWMEEVVKLEPHMVFCWCPAYYV